MENKESGEGLKEKAGRIWDNDRYKDNEKNN